MRFIDSSVFLHALLIPRRKLKPKEREIKERAKSILERIEGGEEASLTTSHASEVVNIVESALGLQGSLGLLAWLVTAPNVNVITVDRQSYSAALSVAREKQVSANDALAYLAMKQLALAEIYSFDRHFDNFKDVKRLVN